MNKQTKYRKKMHSKGLCVQCGGKLATKWLCRKCADVANEWQKKYYHKRNNVDKKMVAVGSPHKGENFWYKKWVAAKKKEQKQHSLAHVMCHEGESVILRS